MSRPAVVPTILCNMQGGSFPWKYRGRNLEQTLSETWSKVLHY